MKQLHFSIILFCLLISNVSMADGNEERKLSAFNRIIVGSQVSVILIHADSNHITVGTDNIAFEDVITDVSNFTLTVKLKKQVANGGATVVIYYTEKLTELITEKGVNIVSQYSVYADKLSINTRLGGSVRIEVDASKIEIDAMNAQVVLWGSVKELYIRASQNAFIDCTELNYGSKNVVESNSIVKLKE